ncbi:hypothetical protein [Flaviaesturariibacter amylovorans]|uniref:DUF3899 domain-containing protein n=1 Tax=Flaviaesturariibacter amylovorans TaxID=1084520 RepID=A0ABP8HN63_9BACT
MERFFNSWIFKCLVYANLAYVLFAFVAMLMFVPKLAGNGLDITLLDGVGRVAFDFFFGPVKASYWAAGLIVLVNLPFKYAEQNMSLRSTFAERKLRSYQNWYEVYFLLLLLVLLVGSVLLFLYGGQLGA